MRPRFEGAVDGVQPIITPATTVMDEPTNFEFDGKEYTPNNYGEKFHGQVTVRKPLGDSLNVATVKVAEMVGYTRVTDMAHQFEASILSFHSAHAVRGAPGRMK